MALSVSVIMFAYNEGAHLREVVGETILELERHGGDWELVLVDDGSTDDTGSIMDEIAASHRAVTVIHHVGNRGIGEAVHTGYGAASREFVCILPADGQIRMSEMVKLFGPAVEGADLVLGRYVQRHEVDRWHRMVLSRGLRLLVRVLTGVGHRLDSAFLFRRSILEEIPLESRSFFVNLELPIRILRGACRTGSYRVAEVDIRVHPRISGRSKVVKSKQMALVAGDLLKLGWHLFGEDLAAWTGARRTGRRPRDP